MMVTYDIACQLRADAERTNDPKLYQLAANTFAALGMLAAASRMRERAEHYAKAA